MILNLKKTFSLLNFIFHVYNGNKCGYNATYCCVILYQCLLSENIKSMKYRFKINLRENYTIYKKELGVQNYCLEKCNF